MTTLSISIVLPIYKNRETLLELTQRLKAVMEQQNLEYEILLINDDCPAGSKDVIEKLACEDFHIKSFHFEKNVGQHRAALKGIEMSRGLIVACMDADLQDLPEDIPRLLQVFKDPIHAVFAGRKGKYESSMRLLTSKCFKTFLHFFCPIPKDAGMFFVMTREMANSLLKIPMKKPFVVAMIGLTGFKTRSIPIMRQKRISGKGAYSSWQRLSIGIATICQIPSLKRALKN